MECPLDVQLDIEVRRMTAPGNDNSPILDATDYFIVHCLGRSEVPRALIGSLAPAATTDWRVSFFVRGY